LKSTTIRSWGTNTLTISDADLPKIVNPDERPITVTNSSSKSRKLFSNGGTGLKLEATVPANSAPQTFQGIRGDIWGFEDPNGSGTTLVKSTTIRNWGTNTLTVTDTDFPPTGNPNDRTLTVTNGSSGTIKLYLSNLSGVWTEKETLKAGETKPVTGIVGENWGFGDPNSSGTVNIIKQTTIVALGFNVLHITDSEIPTPLPPTPTNKSVTITFKNQSSSISYIYRDGGVFNKVLIGTVGPWKSEDLNLSPGSDIAIKANGSFFTTATYRVPSKNATFSFR
jgi:hypothetical protein